MAENLFNIAWCSAIVCHGATGAVLPGVPVIVELLDIEGAPSFEMQLMQRSRLATGFLIKENRVNKQQMTRFFY
jgi:hypothetical protein